VDKNYKGVIWTNHALERMRERGIKQGDAWATFKRPDTSKYAKTKKAYVYYRTWDNTRIEVIAKKNEKGEWLVLSVWSKPTNRSIKEKSAKKTFLGFFKKLFSVL